MIGETGGDSRDGAAAARGDPVTNKSSTSHAASRFTTCSGSTTPSTDNSTGTSEDLGVRLPRVTRNVFRTRDNRMRPSFREACWTAARICCVSRTPCSPPGDAENSHGGNVPELPDAGDSSEGKLAPTGMNATFEGIVLSQESFRAGR